MKDKIVELLEDATAPLSAKPNVAGIRYIANRLIANGVTVRQKGEWILQTHDDGYGEFELWHCSRCEVASANKRNFCHYCGADMRGEHETD